MHPNFVLKSIFRNISLSVLFFSFATLAYAQDSEFSVSGGSVVEGNAGAPVITFTISRADTSAAASVDYATANSTATAGVDYTSTSGTANFAPLQDTVMVTVNVTPDALVELDETFAFNLSNPSAPSTIVTASATGTITNDDSAAFTIDDVTVNEGNAGTSTATFTVTLDNAVDTALALDFATSPGSANPADSDYSFASGTLNFSGTAGETKTLDVTINGDAKVERDETFFVTLGNLMNSGRSVSIGDPQGLGTITNEDQASVSIADAAIAESDSPGTATLTFTVTLTGEVDTGVNFDFASSDGTATVASSDYVGKTGTQGFLGTDGETVNISITLNGDDVVELDETFLIDLSNLNASGRNVIFSDAQATGTIQNDETASFTIDDQATAEGDSGTVVLTYTVTLDTAVEIPVTVDFTTTDGTAAAGTDFVATSGTLNFAGTAGETETFTVTTNGDILVELDEAFTVDLSNVQASGRDVVIADAQGAGSITNDDAATITINDVSMSEGDAGTINYLFQVTIDFPVDVDVTLDAISADGTATVADGDYVMTNGTVTFLQINGATTQSATVVVNGDTKVEFDDNFFLNLSNIQAMGRDVTFADAQGEGTIVNQDTGTVSINDVTQVEGNAGTSNFVFTVTLSNATAVGISVDAVDSEGTALVSDNDFALTGLQTLNFVGTAGETQTYTVVVNGDIKKEVDQTFTVALSNIVNGGLPVTIADGNGLGTIQNDDANNPPVANPESYSTDEDSILNIAAAGVLDNDTDIDDFHQDGLFVKTADTLSAQGAEVTVNADGSFSYDPADSFALQALNPGDSVVDTFTYTVEDPEGLTDTATVSITVDGIFEPLAFLWNGFLSTLNVLSVYNPSDTETATATVKLFDIAGNEASSLDIALVPAQNADIIVNDLPGFAADTFGVVKVSFGEKPVDGHATYYRFNEANPDLLDFEISSLLEEGLFGQTFTEFNTIPTGTATETVANFLTLVNDDNESATFTVELLSDSGTLLLTNVVVLAPNARADIQAGHENPGVNNFGLVRITPANNQQRYFAQLNRYGLDSAGALTGFSMQVEVRAGADEQFAQISKGGNADNFIVVASTASVTQTVDVTFFDNSSGSVVTLPVVLTPFAQTHINANQFIGDGISGLVSADSRTDMSFLLNSTVYFRENGPVTASYATAGRTGIAASSFGNFNSFLGQFNQLKLFNVSGSAVNLDVTVHNFDGTFIGTTTLNVQPSRGFDVNLESLFAIPAETVGRLKVEAPMDDQVFAEILHVKPVDNGNATFTIDGTASIPLR